MPATIIVNADDLGADSEVNQAIIESFERGLISSASIIPTMPGFDEACDLVDAGKLHAGVNQFTRRGWEKVSPPLDERT